MIEIDTSTLRNGYGLQTAVHIVTRYNIYRTTMESNGTVPTDFKIFRNRMQSPYVNEESALMTNPDIHEFANADTD